MRAERGASAVFETHYCVLLWTTAVLPIKASQISVRKWETARGVEHNASMASDAPGITSSTPRTMPDKISLGASLGPLDRIIGGLTLNIFKIPLICSWGTSGKAGYTAYAKGYIHLD